MRYKKYKDSGIEWIGEIPEHWDIKKLKYTLSTLESGSRQTGGGNQLTQGVFSLGGEHIGWFGELLLNNPKLISEEYYENLNNGKIIENDILLVKDGATIGKIAIVKEKPFEKCAVNEHVFILRANEKYVPDFIFYYLWCDVGQMQILMNIKGSAQPGLNTNFVNDTFLTSLSKKEQIAIANYLDRKTAEIDDLIAKKEQLLALYEEEKTAVINSAVTGKFLMDNGQLKIDNYPLSTINCPFKPSGVEWLGNIPEHWEVKKLKYVAYFQRGFDLSSNNFEQGDVPVYGSNGIIGFHKKATTLAPSITIGRSGSVGEVNFISSNYWAHNTALFLLNSFDNDVIFLFHLLKSIDLKSQSAGTAVGTLNRNNIHQIKVGVPSKKEQTAIVAHIEKESARIDGKVEKTKKLIDLLKEYRTALISEAVTGKIKVSN